MGLWGVSWFSPTVQGWLGAWPGFAPTVGGFLYVTLASVGMGLLASTLRWLVIDTLHHRTGVYKPVWNFRKLQQNIDAFDRLIEIHYRYYQAYGNSLVAMVFAYICWRIAGPSSTTYGLLPEVLVLALGALLWIGSRDTLRKYYSRGAMTLEG